MLQHLIKFSLLLFLIAGASYGLHSYIYNSMFPEKSMEILNFAYKFNIGITFLFTSTIIFAREKMKEQLGFIFLAGSFVKLGIFLFLIKTSDFTINKTVFLNFFIPYVLCVGIEIYYVIKVINEANFQKDK